MQPYKINNKKIFSNYASSLWSMFSNYLFLPIFLVYLGPSQFGFFALITIFQSAVSLLDFGISATVKQGLATGRNRSLIIDTYEEIYVSIIALIGIIFFFLSDYLLSNFPYLEENNISGYLLIWMLILLLSSMMTNFYNSILWGMNRQVEVSIINVISSVFKNVGGVFVAIVSKEILYVIAFQAISTAIVSIGVRVYIYSLGYKFKWFKDNKKKKASILRFNLKFTIGAFFLSLLSFLNYQFDKVVLTSEIPIELLGYYSLLFVLSQISVSIASPLSHSYYPLLVNILSNPKKDINKLQVEYNKCFSLSSALLIPVIITLLFFGYQILEVWSGQKEVAEQLSSIILIMILASSLQSFLTLPYSTLMAARKSLVLTQVNGIATVIYIVSCLLLIKEYDIFGAAISWLIYNLVSVILVLSYFYSNFEIRITNKIKLSMVFILNLLALYFIHFISNNFNNSSLVILIAIFNTILMVLNIKYLTPDRWKSITSKINFIS